MKYLIEEEDGKDTPKQDVYLIVSKNQNTKFWLEKLFSNKINTIYYIENGEVKFYQQGHLQYIGMNITYGHTVAHFENKQLVWLEAYKINKETMQLELLPDYQDGVGSYFQVEPIILLTNIFDENAIPPRNILTRKG